MADQAGQEFEVRSRGLAFVSSENEGAVAALMIIAAGDPSINSVAEGWRTLETPPTEERRGEGANYETAKHSYFYEEANIGARFQESNSPDNGPPAGFQVSTPMRNDNSKDSPAAIKHTQKTGPAMGNGKDPHKEQASCNSTHSFLYARAESHSTVTDAVLGVDHAFSSTKLRRANLKPLCQSQKTAKALCSMGSCTKQAIPFLSSSKASFLPNSEEERLFDCEPFQFLATTKNAQSSRHRGNTCKEARARITPVYRLHELRIDAEIFKLPELFFEMCVEAFSCDFIVQYHSSIEGHRPACHLKRSFGRPRYSLGKPANKIAKHVEYISSNGLFQSRPPSTVSRAGCVADERDPSISRSVQKEKFQRQPPKRPGLSQKPKPQQRALLPHQVNSQEIPSFQMSSQSQLLSKAAEHHLQINPELQCGLQDVSTQALGPVVDTPMHYVFASTETPGVERQLLPIQQVEHEPLRHSMTAGYVQPSSQACSMPSSLSSAKMPAQAHSAQLNMPTYVVTGNPARDITTSVGSRPSSQTTNIRHTANQLLQYALRVIPVPSVEHVEQSSATANRASQTSREETHSTPKSSNQSLYLSDKSFTAASSTPTTPMDFTAEMNVSEFLIPTGDFSYSSAVKEARVASSSFERNLHTLQHAIQGLSQSHAVLSTTNEYSRQAPEIDPQILMYQDESTPDQNKNAYHIQSAPQVTRSNEQVACVIRPQVRLQAQGAPLQPQIIPVPVQDLPLEEQRAPFQGQHITTQAHGSKLKAQDAPIQALGTSFRTPSGPPQAHSHPHNANWNFLQIRGTALQEPRTPFPSRSFIQQSEGVPQHTTKVSQEALNATLQVQGVPQQARDVPQHAVGITKHVLGVPQQAQGTSQLARCIPLQARGIPEQSGGAPQQARGVPLQARGVPLQARGVPLQARGVPQQARGVPQHARGAPRESQRVSMQPLNDQQDPKAAQSNAEYSKQGQPPSDQTGSKQMRQSFRQSSQGSALPQRTHAEGSSPDYSASVPDLEPLSPEQLARLTAAQLSLITGTVRQREKSSSSTDSAPELAQLSPEQLTRLTAAQQRLITENHPPGGHSPGSGDSAPDLEPLPPEELANMTAEKRSRLVRKVRKEHNSPGPSDSVPDLEPLPPKGPAKMNSDLRSRFAQKVTKEDDSPGSNDSVPALEPHYPKQLAKITSSASQAESDVEHTVSEPLPALNHLVFSELRSDTRPVTSESPFSVLEAELLDIQGADIRAKLTNENLKEINMADIQQEVSSQRLQPAQKKLVSAPETLPSTSRQPAEQHEGLHARAEGWLRCEESMHETKKTFQKDDRELQSQSDESRKKRAASPLTQQHPSKVQVNERSENSTQEVISSTGLTPQAHSVKARSFASAVLQTFARISRQKRPEAGQMLDVSCSTDSFTAVSTASHLGSDHATSSRKRTLSSFSELVKTIRNRPSTVSLSRKRRRGDDMANTSQPQTDADSGYLVPWTNSAEASSLLTGDLSTLPFTGMHEKRQGPQVKRGGQWCPPDQDSQEQGSAQQFQEREVLRQEEYLGVSPESLISYENLSLAGMQLPVLTMQDLREIRSSTSSASSEHEDPPVGSATPSLEHETPTLLIPAHVGPLQDQSVETASSEGSVRDLSEI